MGARQETSDDGLIEEINIVPLVDIVLVLLIIFMLTANFMDQQALRVNLPHAAGSDGPVPGTLSVVIDADNQLYINGTERSLESILEEVARTPGGAAQATVLIQGDRSASHGRVTEVMGALKGAGVIRFAINLDPGIKTASPGNGAAKP